MNMIDNTKALLKEFNGETYKKTIVDNMEYAIESKNLIKKSLQNKGSEITDKTVFRDYYKEIDKLNEWQPQLDWWDIKKIIQEDTEDYPAKAIFLLLDSFGDTETFSFSASIAKIKTSDGVEYTKTSTHTWDASKDKECSKGYKTRYIIVYLNNHSQYNELPWNLISMDHKSELLWFVAKDGVITFIHGSGNNFAQSTLLEAIETINCHLRSDMRSFNTTPNLKKIDTCYVTNFYYFATSGLKNITLNVSDIDYNNVATQNFFNNCYNLETINIIGGDLLITNLNNFLTTCVNLKKISNNIKISADVTNFNSSFHNLWSLEELEIEFDLKNQQSNFTNFLQSNYSLKRVKLKNIRKSGLNLSENRLLEHDTLISILNELYDYSSSEEVYTLNLGAANLLKLADKEKAIATDKGWTLN